MVLQYAAPVTFFVGTFGTPRADLIKGLAFASAICVASFALFLSQIGSIFTMAAFIVLAR